MASETDSTQPRKSKVLVPMALVVLVPVDHPDGPTDGIEFFTEGHMSGPSFVITDASQAQPFVEAMSETIRTSEAASEAIGRMLEFAHDASKNMPGVVCEWTPWYCGVPFRRI
jgi:hypothetical protein